jgi:hypothetical protein
MQGEAAAAAAEDPSLVLVFSVFVMNDPDALPGSSSTAPTRRLYGACIRTVRTHY